MTGDRKKDKETQVQKNCRYLSGTMNPWYSLHIQCILSKNTLYVRKLDLILVTTCQSHESEVNYCKIPTNQVEFQSS